MSTKISPADVNGLPAPPGALPDRGRARSFPWGALVTVVLALLCLPFLLTSSEGQRGLLAFSVAGTLFFLIKRVPAQGVAASLAYLAVVGGLRRWLLPVFDWSGTDPLLIAAPGAALAFLLVSQSRTPPTRLMRLLTVLMILMTVEIVNPLQGGLEVGLAGTLFYLGPLLWYFVGRKLGSELILRRVFRTIVWVSIASALYGLYQTYFGFNLGERLWIKTVSSQYQALNISSTVVRAFSFFTSSQEYTQFVTLGVVMLWVLFLRGRRIALAPIPVLAVALFLASSRGPIVTTLLTCVILWAVQGRSRQQWGPRLVVAAVVAVFGLSSGLHQIQGSTFSDGTQALVSHQVGGLLNPLDSQQSTAGDHAGLVLGGILGGFRNPIGLGLGATTIAAQKFGGAGGGAEVDIANMFLSLGFIGGLVYVAAISVVLLMVFRHWQATRTLASLGLLGILLALFGQWLNGGAYSTSMLAWFCIGTLDRFVREGARRAAPAADKTPPARAPLAVARAVTPAS